MRKTLFFITLAVMIWSACQSEPPDSGSDTPVFLVGFEDISSGNGMAMTAGIDGIYLFTRVDRGTDNVLVMSGAFAEATCPTGDCSGSVKFEFRNTWIENFANPDEIFAADTSWEYKSPFSDTLALETVAIKWVTSEGRVFRSDILPQHQDSSGALPHFIILNSEQWETNERGENTWKMDVNFSCWVFDTLQQEERKITGGGVIAVGYR